MGMSDSRRVCPFCSYSYLADMPSCPNCAALNEPSVQQALPPVEVKPHRRSLSGKALAAIIIVVSLGFAAIIVASSNLSRLSQFLGSKESPVSVFQLHAPQPKVIPREQLVEFTLGLINADRANFSLPAVQLSSNEAAQVHAEDVFNTKQISHWMTNGEKPYMTYTRYGGTGNVHQNVAIAGFSADQYSKCKAGLLACEPIDSMSALKQLEYQMMYDDVSCCDNGHRDNILDPHHTHVSIGIAYDEYYLAFVENFEDNYGLQTAVSNGSVQITGQLKAGTLKQIEVHYDLLPTPAAYDQNKKLLSYSSGKILAAIAPPLPLGYLYKQPAEYRVISASQWSVEGNSVIVAFPLGPVVRLEGSTVAAQQGVYTIYAVVEDNQGRLFDAASYSIFVASSGASS